MKKHLKILFLGIVGISIIISAFYLAYTFYKIEELRDVIILSLLIYYIYFIGDILNYFFKNKLK